MSRKRRNRIAILLLLPAIIFMWIMGWVLYWIESGHEPVQPQQAEIEDITYGEERVK